jgi:hypothetical protein
LAHFLSVSGVDAAVKPRRKQGPKNGYVMAKFQAIKK